MTPNRSFVLLLVIGFSASALAGCLEDDAPGGDDSPPTSPTSGGDGDGGAVDAGGVACDAPGEAEPSSFTPGNPRATLVTSMGEIVVELAREKAPVTVSNFVNHSESGLYDGTKFHRVIGPAKSPPDGFMIQGGDPNSKDDDPSDDGRGGPDTRIPDEFHPDLRHDVAGILSMANSGPNTGGSQFFVTLAPTPWLDDKHAVFGRVVEGMDVVKAIGSVETGANDRPTQDVVLQEVVITEPENAGTPEHGAGTHLAVSAKKTDPERGARFALIVTNTGNVRDVFSASATVPDGWACSVDRASVLVPPGTARILFVTVVPPADSSGDTTIPLKAWSRTDPSKTAESDVTVSVGGLGSPAAESGSSVKGNYVGMLEDGRLFDTSIEAVAKNPDMGKSAFWGSDAQHRYQPFEFQVGGGVIEGFSELATGARPGETRTGAMPPEKAYGPQGSDLSGKTLVFELEIIEVS